MPRASTSGGWSNSSDVLFRAWVSELIGMLITAGFVRTSDTGQIDAATATKPVGFNGRSAPAIFRFNDSLQATAPVFIRLTFGNGTNSANNPGVSVQVGTGTDGAGNLTGLFTEVHVLSSAVSASGATDIPSRAVHRAGVGILAFKIGGVSSAGQLSPCAFIIQRTMDNTGAPTGEGVMLCTPLMGANGNTNYGNLSKIIYGSSAVANMISNAWLGQINGQITDSRVGLSPQAFLHWMMTPKQRPMIGTIGFIRGEVPFLAEMTLPIVGVTSRNYLCVGEAFGNTLRAQGNVDTAIIWED